MKKLIIFLLFVPLFAGCRISVSAKELSFHAAVDQAAYLSDEDPALYEDTNKDNSDSLD